MASINETFVQQATERATTDAAFRSRLLADPKAAIEEIGGTVPASLAVRAIEEGGAAPAGADAVIVVPAFGGAAQELGVEELEEVSGGLIADSTNGTCGNVNKCSAVGL